MKNAVIYCRVSTAEQTENFSLPTQAKACRAYCEKHGYSVVKEFVDAGESAKTADRPELKRLLEYCREHKGAVQLLAIYNVSRLARTTADHIDIRLFLRKEGVDLRSVTENIDDSANGQLLENILSAFAQFDNNQKSERTKAGMTTALERGRWTYQPPVGYLCGDRDGASMVLDVERVELIRAAFRDVAAGVKPSDVLQRITHLGLRSRKGNLISPQSFYKLIRNPVYAGRIETMGVRTKGDFEPVVESHLFDRTQEALARNERRAGNRKSKNPDFPLRHFVRCGECDNPLTGSWSGGRSKKYAYYHCHKCQSVRMPRSQLEMEFLEIVRALKPSPVCLRLFEAIVRDVWKKRQRNASNEMALTKRRIRDLKRRLVRLDESYACDRSIDGQSYVPLRDKLRKDIRYAEMELSDVHFDDFELEVALKASHEVLSRGAELWKASKFTQKTKLQAAIFPNGLSHDGEKFRTATTSFVFKELMNKGGNEKKVATPRGIALMWTPKLQGKAEIAA